MDLSIIIPSYRSEKTLAHCLESATRQKTSLSYEIIVIDSSPERYVDNIIKKFPTVKFIKLENKTYAGMARNIGSSEAQGELLMFIDADIVLGERVLDEVIYYYKSGHNVFAGSIDMWEGKHNSVLDKFEWFFEFSEFKSNMQQGTRWCLPSSFLAIKKILFDSEKFLNIETSEDAELTIRISKKKQVLYFNPKLKISHIFQTSFIGLLTKSFKFGYSNMLLREVHNISGSKVVKNKILILLAIPIFGFIKFIKISYRNIRYNKSYDKLLYLSTILLMFIVILFWIFGSYTRAVCRYLK